MKRRTVLLLILAFVSPLVVMGRGGHSSNDSNLPAAQSFRQSAAINISQPFSGGHNRNYPSLQNFQQRVNLQPSYGRIRWQSTSQTSFQLRSRGFNTQPNIRGIQTQLGSPVNQRPSARTNSVQPVRSANVVHHHPYTPGYIRKKLQNIGVTSEPGYITNRSEIIHTDRQHSTIQFPQKGMDGKPLTATEVSPRRFNDPVVRDHMARIENNAWRTKIQGLNRNENKVGQYYWHKDSGFDYCHYVDHRGYHWYGWYAKNKFFWNRNFNGRWWWYDLDYDRWSFWNDGFWWWQDPYHVGDLYCYDNDDYVPCNSAEDQVAVTGPDNSSMRTYNSPDGTRVVKVVSDTMDAFLYDTANPPAFNPVYLASGVKSIQFSNTGNGRPEEIVLTLNDGSFDMFDGQGKPYNP